MDLLNSQKSSGDQPLAEKLRPKTLEEVLGQSHIVGDQSQLGILLRQGFIPHLILWGPPGSGKTSLALVLAQYGQFEFIAVNAVESSSKELRDIAEQAKERKIFYQQKTLLFIDEIHRFNKAQQDILLSYMEQGWFTLVGATTESPSYELNRALLSRSRVVKLLGLQEKDFMVLLQRAEQLYQISLQDFLSADLLRQLIRHADGDGRRFLNSLELIFNSAKLKYNLSFSENKKMFTSEELQDLLQMRILNYDKKSDQHYQLISALIKSVRGSDPDAALYYMVRMLEAGEDPVFIARRFLILASEDIGNADPKALSLAIAGLQTVEAIGLPEAKITLSQVCTYLSSCPKSNAAYKALKKAEEFVSQNRSFEVATVLRTPRDIHYKYPHDYAKSWVEQNHWPEGLSPQRFYEPTDRGFEKNLKDYLSWLKRNE